MKKERKVGRKKRKEERKEGTETGRGKEDKRERGRRE